MTSSEKMPAPALITLSRESLREAAVADGAQVIGVTGHLMLDARERAETERYIRQQCRTLFEGHSGTVRLLSGLAPGADLVATAAILDEADRAHIKVELIALLPRSAERLLVDWLRRSKELGQTVSPDSLQRVRLLLATLLARSSTTLDLCTTVGGDNHQAAYRRLAAVLAVVPSRLFAVAREGYGGMSGGTAEILAWRRDPTSIPPALLELVEGLGRGGETHLIDPRGHIAPAAVSEAEQRSEQALTQAIRTHLKAGDALSAYDLAARALERGGESAPLRYLLLLSLAAAGSVYSALEQFERWAPPESERDEDWLALRGRLLKDLAFSGVDVQANLERAAAEYGAAYAKTGGMFSGINAATLYLLCGEGARAARLAKDLLQLPAEPPQGTPAARYYSHASRAEAHLVLTELDACREELAKASTLLRDDLITRSRTRRQLARIAAHHGVDAGGLIDLLEMPNVYVLGASSLASGALPASLARRIEGAPLFAVADQQPHTLGRIEACVRSGARLNLILPEDREELLEHCRVEHGSATAERLARIIEGAERVSSLRGFLVTEKAWCLAEAVRLAHGLAQVAASGLGVGVCALQPPAEATDWSVDAAPAVPAIAAVKNRRMVGLIFTDVVGFRRFTDEDVAAFWAIVMPALGEEVAAYGDQVLLAATWGDAIHVVTTGAEPAANLCLRLIDRVAALRASGTGALANLRIRLGAHFAPAFEGYDPVERQRTYFGSQLAFAASVEPVTPPSMAYVTEAFAAQLALEAPGRFQMEYAGELELAKRYGTFRLHGLTPTSG